MENFAAEGGFRVSAIRTQSGEVRGVRIASSVGGPCRMANPWPGKAVEIAVTDGSPPTSAPGDQPHFVFPTSQGKTYTLRPK